jgi:Ca2+/Na+ antiporter
MTELIKRILNNLTGADTWIAIIAIAVGLAGWFYFSKAKKAEQNIVKRQILFAGLFFLLAILAIATNHYLFIFLIPNFQEALPAFWSCAWKAMMRNAAVNVS